MDETLGPCDLSLLDGNNDITKPKGPSLPRRTPLHWTKGPTQGQGTRTTTHPFNIAYGDDFVGVCRRQIDGISVP